MEKRFKNNSPTLKKAYWKKTLPELLTYCVILVLLLSFLVAYSTIWALYGSENNITLEQMSFVAPILLALFTCWMVVRLYFLRNRFPNLYRKDGETIIEITSSKEGKDILTIKNENNRILCEEPLKNFRIKEIDKCWFFKLKTSFWLLVPEENTSIDFKKKIEEIKRAIL